MARKSLRETGGLVGCSGGAASTYRQYAPADNFGGYIEGHGAANLGFGEKSLGRDCFMTQRDRICAAIGAGYNTATAISNYLDLDRKQAVNALTAMAAIGRIRKIGELKEGRSPPVSRWAISETYRAPARCIPVETPSWVLPKHQKIFRSIARFVDEESAAKWARGMKRSLAKEEPKNDVSNKRTLAQNALVC